jgi:hypothetical protein
MTTPPFSPAGRDENVRCSGATQIIKDNEVIQRRHIRDIVMIPIHLPESVQQVLPGPGQAGIKSDAGH